MPAYSVEIKKSAAKEIESLDRKFIPLVWKKINSLSKNPRPASSQKLTGSKTSYSLPLGSYRILYQINDRLRTVIIYAVGHRREIYR
jgi:mRNA interferase RelE/StbE